MKRQLVNGDIRVWDVLQEHPETYGVFRKFGCPDMRKGIFAVSAHFMKLRWAARVHHIELDDLLKSLNEAIAKKEESRSTTLH